MTSQGLVQHTVQEILSMGKRVFPSSHTESADLIAYNDDILVNILVHLPEKSLQRFKKFGELNLDTPDRKPHTSTADLFTWSETPQPDSAASRSSRPHQPSDGIRKVVFGGQVIDEESESLNKRKPSSIYKMKEMTGSGIFAANGEDDEAEPGSANLASNNKTGI